MEKHQEDILLDKFGEISKYLATTDEKVNVRNVIDILIHTSDIVFGRMKKENVALVHFLESLEMSFVTSVVFNLSLLTDIRDDTKDFMERFHNGVYKYEKPN